MTLAAPWLLVQGLAHDVYLWIPFLMWRGCNVRIPTWRGQPENRFKACVCGSTREAMGTLWSLVYRKGQRLGQTNTKAFNTQPTPGLRSCTLHGLAHLKYREVIRPSLVWRKTHHSTHPPQWPGGQPGSCTWRVAKQRGPGPAREKTKQLPPCCYRACSL